MTRTVTTEVRKRGGSTEPETAQGSGEERSDSPGRDGTDPTIPAGDGPAPMSEHNAQTPIHVSVVIPALNEEAGVGEVIQDVKRVLDAAHVDHEIIVVDDGSTDATGDCARAAGARVVRNPTNKGYGFSLLRGIEAAVHELIAITDADGTYPAGPLPDMLKAAAEYDMVVGRRTGPLYHGSPPKRFSRMVFQFLAEFTCGTRIPDINSGLRVLRRGFVLEHRRAISTGYSFTTTVTLIALLEGQHLLYRDIPYHERTGQSKVRWVRDSLRSLQIITETILLYNPLKAFLLLALACLAAGLLQGVALWLFPSGLAAGITILATAANVALLILALGCVGFIAGATHRMKH